MSQIACIILAYLILKAFAVIALAFRLSPKTRNFSLSIVFGWIGVNLVINSLLLLASVFQSVSNVIIWISLIMIIGLNISFIDPKKILDTFNKCPHSKNLPIIFALAITVGLLYRSLYFYDTSWDALVYGMPRLGFWVSSESLFLHYPTEVVNIFANEWNAELLALSGWLVTGSSMGALAGSVETWLLGFFCVIAALRELGTSRNLSIYISLLILTSPICLGLAMAIKGDLLAALLISVGFFTLCSTSGDRLHRTAWSISVISFAAGAKVTTIPIAGLLIAYGIFVLFQLKAGLKLIAILTLGCSIALSRYFVNLVVYSNPLKRVDGEKTFFGWNTMSENIRGISTKLLEMNIQTPGYELGVMGMGGGLLSFFTLLCLISGFLRQSPAPKLPTAPLVSLFVGSLFILSSIPWQPWSLRYHLAWIIPGIIIIIVFGLNGRIRSWLVSLVCSVIIAICGFQWYTAWRSQEAFPVSFREARNQNYLERKLASHPYLISEVIEEINSGIPGPLVVFNRPDSAIWPLFGERKLNQLILVDSLSALEDTCSNSSAAVAIIGGTSVSGDEVTIRGLISSGFVLREQTVFWTILVRE